MFYSYFFLYTLSGSLINVKLLCNIHMVTFIFNRNNMHDTFCFLVYCMFCEVLLSGIVFKCFEVLFVSHGKCASSWTCIFYRTVRTFQLIHTIFHICVLIINFFFLPKKLSLNFSWLYKHFLDECF